MTAGHELSALWHELSALWHELSALWHRMPACHQLSAIWQVDGAELATSGRMISVSPNFRVGPLGFHAHLAFFAEQNNKTVGNYGQQDQRLALQ